MKTRHVLGACALWVLQGLPAAAMAANHYYVSTTGTADNSGPGTIDQPWGSLKNAIWRLNAGDTLTILNDYRIDSTIWVSGRVGTLTAPITINAGSHPNDQVSRITCATGRDSPCFGINGSSHLTLTGLTVDGSATPPPSRPGKVGLFFMFENHNIVFAKNEVRNAADVSVWLSGNSDAANKDHSYRFENNLIENSHNTALYLVNSLAPQVLGNRIERVIDGDGIVIGDDSTGATIADNIVTQAEGPPGATRDGIKVRPSSDVVIRHNHVDTVSGVGIYLIGPEVSGGTRHQRAQIIDNTVTNVVTSNRNNPDPQCDQGGWPSALNAAHVDDVLVQNNLVYRNFGEGITLNSVTRGRMLRNKAHDNFGVNYYLNNAADTTVDRNEAINNPRLTDYFRCGAPAGGIGMANESSQIQNYVALRNLRITNNILVDGRFGINFFRGGPLHYHQDSGLNNVEILNNTVSRAVGPGLFVTDTPFHANNRVESNIWVQGVASVPVASLPPVGFTCTANLWWATTPSETCRSASDVFADPLFTRPTGTAAKHFKLVAGSPAINAARYTSVMARTWHDFFGNKRPAISPWDIGAHEAP